MFKANFQEDDADPEEAESHVYLGQEVNKCSKRIPAGDCASKGWNKSSDITIVLKESNPADHARLFNVSILCAITYRCGSWTSTKVEKNVLEVREGAME